MSLCGAGGTEVLSREGQRSPPTCEPPWRAAPTALVPGAAEPSTGGAALGKAGSQNRCWVRRGPALGDRRWGPGQPQPAVGQLGSKAHPAGPRCQRSRVIRLLKASCTPPNPQEFGHQSRQARLKQHRARVPQPCPHHPASPTNLAQRDLLFQS